MTAIKVVSRNVRQRFVRWLEETAEAIKEYLKTQEGLSLDIQCPHCSETVDIAELLHFGNIYEFTCNHCKNVFVLVVPKLIVRKGKIEALKNG